MKIGIAGAGLMGRLTALACLQRGWQVSLFDIDSRAGLNNCSQAAAGMLAPYAEIETEDFVIHNMGVESISRWPEIINTLNHAVYFQQAGTLVITHQQDIAEIKRLQSIFKLKFAANKNIVTLTSASDIEKLEPDLEQRFSSAIFLAAEAQISPADILQALGETLIKLGVTWHENTMVDELQPCKIFTNGQAHSFDWVIDTRGIGAKHDLKNLRGVRGELLWLYAPEVHLTRPIRLQHPRIPLYIVPRPNHIYVIGASMIESEDMSPISVKTMMDILSAAFSIHKSFLEARIVKTFVNCRPTFNDNLPKIFFEKGLLRINGLYRHGFLLAPVLMDETLRLIEHGKTNMKYPSIMM